MDRINRINKIQTARPDFLKLLFDLIL